MAEVPVSLEWSVPCEGAVFHIGVHNLPAGQAHGWMEELRSLRASRAGSGCVNCDAPGEFGRRDWMTRVFITDGKGGARPLSDFAGTRLRSVVDRFRWVTALLASPQLRPALRMMFLGHEEGGL